MAPVAPAALAAAPLAAGPLLAAAPLAPPLAAPPPPLSPMHPAVTRIRAVAMPPTRNHVRDMDLPLDCSTAVRRTRGGHGEARSAHPGLDVTMASRRDPNLDLPFPSHAAAAGASEASVSVTSGHRGVITIRHGPRDEASRFD